ncbi:MAG: lamin tail domain-containing protein [Candidatus Latescibacterota bacterium]|nr:MAG: lamin tail domain-containing protein [Candidatus Latescibacterota bacterium]
MRWFSILPIVLVAVAAPVRGASPGDIVISEIMQNPEAVSDTYGEWIELYNATGAAIDIDGWTVGDGASESHVVSNGGPRAVPAGGFLVLGRNDDPAVNGGYECDYAYAGITLSNAADRVVIREGSATIDSVAYDDGGTFPDPAGASMECVDPASDNNVGANWAECVVTAYGAGDYGTPGAPNDPWGAPSGPPSIAGTQHEPAYPGSADTVVVSCQVGDDESVAQVCLYYRVGAGIAQLAVMSAATGTWYEGLVPPAPDGSSVRYYVCATDGSGGASYDPAGAPAETYGYVVEDQLPTVIINEILAQPLGDANGDGLIEAYEDEFIELYNAGASPVDLSGWTLSDDDSPTDRFAFPPGTAIPAFGFLTLFGGGTPQGFTGPVFTDDGRIGNGLSNTGDGVELRREGELIDQHTFGTEGSHGESMIRLPDGYGDWTRPSLEDFDWDYSPQATNGGAVTWTTGKSWGAIKRLFGGSIE